MSILPVTREDFENRFWELLHKEVVCFYSMIKGVCEKDDLSQETKDIIKQIMKEI